MRTTVTVLLDECRASADQFDLQARLFGRTGNEIAAWTIPLAPGRAVFIDSAAPGPWRHAEGSDGILALYTCTADAPSAQERKEFKRLFPIVDWHAVDGRVVTLHSDQVVRRGLKKLQKFTEIVVEEATDERNALVLLNGEDFQPEGALEISVRNAVGTVRSAKYARQMAPFTVHRIELASLLSDLVAFSAGEPLLVTATFASEGLFSRPYVETTGGRWGAYHAGDVYAWAPLPYFAHALIAGEVNPAAVRHDGQTRTIVNLLHSHGDIEDSMWVGASLYDAGGACVARRPAWRLVPRHGLARFDVAELLPDPSVPFHGHVALTFSVAPGRDVPRRLQALFEYRRRDSVARTMTWSDEWNSRVRLAKRDRCAKPPVSRSYFRIREDADVCTEFSITNAGHEGYDRSADIRLTLSGGEGLVSAHNLRLAPFGTCATSVEQMFPGAMAALAPSGLGILIVESESDLANLAFTRHRKTGALAAEHFMWLWTEHEGEFVLPVGS